jgi:hypothetical protein
LEQRLAITVGKGLDTGDGMIGDRKLGPTVARDEGAGGERKEIVGPLRVAGRVEGDGAHSTSARRVGRGEIIKNLDIGAELKAEFGEIRAGLPGYKGPWAESGRHSISSGDDVEETVNVDDSTLEEKFGDTTKRQTMEKGTGALFNGANGAFHFANVTVGSKNVEMDVGEVVAHAIKLGISMDIGDDKTTGGVEGQNGGEFLLNGRASAVGYWRHSAEMDVARNGVHETEFLDKEEIDAECNTVMGGKDVRGKGNWFETQATSSRSSAGGFAFECGNFGPVDGESTSGVVNGNRTVKKVVVAQQSLKNRVVWTTEESV